MTFPIQAERVQHRDAGFALVAVLWFLILVAAVTAPFAVAARTEHWIAANARRQAHLDRLADGLATIVTIALSDPARRQEVPLRSRAFGCPAGKLRATFRLQDQSGLVDLNAAEPRLLSAGLRSLGLATDPADEIAGAIEDFRSYEPRIAGEPASIAVLGGRKGGPFESVVELTDLAPLRDFEPTDLHGVFTVHGRQGVVVASRSPARLDRELKATDGVTIAGGSAEQASAFAVEVTLRDATTSIRGYSGFLVETSSPPNAGFRRLEPLVSSDADADGADAGAPCPAWLAADLETLLREPGS